MTSFIQYRAFIGPRFDDYDWTVLNTDATTSLDIATTLSGDVNSGATSASLASGAGFPSPGGVFLGPSPSSSQQGWEYCKYTGGGSTLTGMVRESATTREHNGVHSAGAPVYLWYPVTTNTGDFSFSWQLNQTYAASQWETSISGVKFVPGVFLNNHLCVIQYRTAPTGAWQLFCLGFIDSPSVQDDFKAYANWTMRIVSSPQLLDRQPTKGVHLGELDIAKQGAASGSAALVLASDERASGDYVAAEPDFSASSMVDEDNSTIAIFERYHGPEQTFLIDNGDQSQKWDLRFSQIHLLPAQGLPPGARWFELILIANSSYEDYFLNIYDPLSPNNRYEWKLPSASSIDPEDLIIVCENESIFRKLNPLANPAAIFENRLLFSKLTHAGGVLWIKQTAFWRNYVRWGSGGTISGAPEPDADPVSGWWSGPSLPVLAPGQTYRYIHGRNNLTNSKDYYDVSLVKTPGYAIAEDYDTYVTIELPGIDLYLDGDITSAIPGIGGQLKIKDKAGNASTAGLDASGIVIIGDEQFNYAKSDGYITLTSARGAVGGAAAAHVDGDPIYVMVSGVKTAGPPIQQISWHHYNGSTHVRDFTVHCSLSTITPRSPEDDPALVDWTPVATVTGHTASSWTYTFPAPQRVKTLLLRISKVNNAPARPRINDFRAILDTAAYQSGLWLAGGQNAYALVRQIVLNAGFPGNSIIQSGSGHPTLDKLTTADDKAWTVAADIADFAGCRLLTGRDSKMSLAVDTYWTTTPSPSHTWTKSNAGAAEKVWGNGLGVSQVKLPWRTPDGATKGTEVYPATAGNFGETNEQKEHIYANATAAQTAVRKYYCLYRYPYTAVVDLPDGDLTVQPGQIHRLQWQFADAPQEINRLYMVTGVEHHIINNQLSTSLSLMQIEREAEN